MRFTEPASEALKELRDLSGELELLSLDPAQPAPVSVSVSNETATSSPQQLAAGFRRTVLLEAVVQYRLDEFPGRARGNAAVAGLIAGHDLEKFVGDLLLASTIANPGAVHPRVVECSVGGSLRSTFQLRPNNIGFAREEAERIGWPPLAQFPLDQSLRWLRGVPGFIEGVPRGPLGRAVSSVSQLLGFNAPGDGMELMWALVGLEALYTQGKEGLGQQLFEKAELLLGRPTTHGRSVRRLHGFRSRFVHGDTDFPLAYSPYYGDTWADAIVPAAEHGAVATALLVATLQAMLAASRAELLFKWQLL
jgi:hypothetical protein